VEIQLDLSQGLFSSASVDSGSLLLLKSIAAQIPPNSLSKVLDVGCGVGTLGLSIAKRCPNAQITMVDRDELAVEFTRRNATINRLRNIVVDSRLMLEGPHEWPYDLIISNCPAKAGDPVLTDFLIHSPSLLVPGGRVAIVIVHTLSERCREVLRKKKFIISHEDASMRHVVFHYHATEVYQSRSNSDILAPYIRHSGDFMLNQTRYHLDTVWNIGDFDTPSWRLQLMAKLLTRENLSGILGFWSPGQGHLAALACQKKSTTPEKVILAGRDRLELLLSAHNLRKAGFHNPIILQPLPDVASLASLNLNKAMDFLLTDLNPIPRSDWTAPLRNAATSILKTRGRWAMLGRSADIAALTKNTWGWTPIADKRYHGWRAAIFQKN